MQEGPQVSRLGRRDFLSIAGGTAAALVLSSCTSVQTLLPEPDPLRPSEASEPQQYDNEVSYDSPEPTKPSKHPNTTDPSPKETEPSPEPTKTPEPARPDSHKGLPRSHFIHNGPHDARRIAITIDDFFGVEGVDYLDGVLDVAAATSAEMTLFPTGASVDAHRAAGRSESWQRAEAEGHQIGNHSYDHIDLAKLSRFQPGKVRDQLLRTHDAIESALGHDCPKLLMRPPFGAGGFPDVPGSGRTKMGREHIRVMNIVKGLGYYMTMWTTDSNFIDQQGNVQLAYGNPAKQDKEFIRKILHHPAEKAVNGSIILIHPTTLSVKGMKNLITQLHDRNYDLTTVSGLFDKKSA